MHPLFGSSMSLTLKGCCEQRSNLFATDLSPQSHSWLCFWRFPVLSPSCNSNYLGLYIVYQERLQTLAKLIITSAGRHQFGVITLLNYLPIVHHNYAVESVQTAQAVGDH